MQALYPYLAPALRPLIARAAEGLPGVEEIRLRRGGPLQLVHGGGDHFVTPQGDRCRRPELAYRVSDDDLSRTFQLIAQGSVYAFEEELKHGFLTLPGGHRVGVVGRGVLQGGQIKSLRHIGALNMRLAREFPGAAKGLLPHLRRPGGGLYSTLLISPPQAGKTTLLRDLIRLSSDELELKVGLVDERSEVAGSLGGVAQRQVGCRTDVLDGCPKAEGLLLLIRSMSPQLVAVDELGSSADGLAVLEALHSGVTVLATAHGVSVADLEGRPTFGSLFQQKAFERAVVLSRRLGVGTVEQIVELPAKRPLAVQPFRAAGGEPNGLDQTVGQRPGGGGARDHRFSAFRRVEPPAQTPTRTGRRPEPARK